MPKKKIAFILGTAREGRTSERVARFVFDVASKREDIEPTFVDVRDYAQTATHAKDQPTEVKNRWMALAATMDGFVIISPEYNHGYPGELKMFLDNAYAEYVGKSVAIIGVSAGPVGGARMVENLKPILSAFQMTIINASAYFANVNTLFGPDGMILDPEGWGKRITGVLDEVVKYTK